MDADQAAQLKIEDVELPAGVACGEVEGQGGTGAVLTHGKAAKFIAAALDQTDDATDCAFARVELDSDPLGCLEAAHQRDSIISVFALLGGTSGQTFARGSMRTWHSTGPEVASSRSIAPSTCAR